MKRFLFLCYFLATAAGSDFAFAKGPKLSDIEKNPKASKILENAFSGNSCISPLAFDFEIVQKNNDHEYIIQGEGGSFRNGILKTKRAIYDSTGIPVGIKIKHVGQKSLPLQNGFSKDFQVWEECAYDEKMDCITYRSTDPSASWPRRPKDIKCQNIEKRIIDVKKVEPASTEDGNSCSADCYYRLSSKKYEALKCYEECDKKYKK